MIPAIYAEPSLKYENFGEYFWYLSGNTFGVIMQAGCRSEKTKIPPLFNTRATSLKILLTSLSVATLRTTIFITTASNKLLFRNGIRTASALVKFRFLIPGYCFLQRLIHLSDLSTPTTTAPLSAIAFVRFPGPQPISRTRFP